MRARLAALLLSLTLPLSVAAGQAPPPAFRLAGQPVQGGLLIGMAPAGAISLALDGRALPLARDGRFLLGFDRDAPLTARLVAGFGDGSEVAETLSVARPVAPTIPIAWPWLTL